MLYDYTLKVGDSHVISEYSSFIVTNIDTVIINGKLRKRFDFAGYDVWVEGIGSIKRILYDPLSPILLYDLGFFMNYCKEDGTIVYHTDEWFFSKEECPTVSLNKTEYSDKILLINPVKDCLVFNAELLDKPYALEVIDMQGKIVMQSIISGEQNSKPISNIAVGLYLYRIMDNGKTLYQGKVIKTN